MNENTDIELDESADELYKLLGEMDDTDRSGETESLEFEEETVDELRISSLNMACNVASFLDSVRIGSSKQTIDALKTKICKSTSTLSKMIPGYNGLNLRFCGYSRGGKKENYILSSGSFYADMEHLKSTEKRRSGKGDFLVDRATKAFSTFLDMGIYSIILKYDKEDLRFERMEKNLCSLEKFYDPSKSGEIINDERNIPDPNLTNTHLISEMGSREFSALVDKVSDALNKNDELPIISIYEAMFAIKKIKNRLNRPLIEINKIKHFISTNGKTVTPAEAKLGRDVIYAFKGNQKNLALAIVCLGDRYYKGAPASVLFWKLYSANSLVTELQGSESKKLAINRISNGLRNAPEESYKSICFADRNLVLEIKGKKKSIANVDMELAGSFNFYKKRAAIKDKLVKTYRQQFIPTDNEIRILSQDLTTDVFEAKNIINAIQSCFAGDLTFKRQEFEQHMQLFVEYGPKIFDLFWRLLEKLPQKNLRLDFLNSLILLTDKLPDKSEPLKYLLEKFVSSHDELKPSDRNNMMLANLLLRKYNKELNIDIAKTPEEVLKVRDGLDDVLVSWVCNYLESDKLLYLQKAMRLRDELFDCIAAEEKDKNSRSILLVSTINEYYMFLALSGSEIARTIFRSSIFELGEPDSEIYKKELSKKDIERLFSVLQISLRGLGRIRDVDDTHLMFWFKANTFKYYDKLGSKVSKQAVAKLERLADLLIVDN